MLELNTLLEPGMLVLNPDQESWGTGQVQSIVGDRITVNFENTGKLVIDGSQVLLEAAPEPADAKGEQTAANPFRQSAL